MASKRISKKQEAFINEYLQCWNATKAAIKAGYSEKSARVAGHRLITNDNISDIIAERVKEMCMSADEALKLLSEQAHGTLEDCYDIEMVESRLKPGLMIPVYHLNLLKAKEKGKLHLIESITPSAYGTKVKLYSSQRALELIGKAHGLFAENKVPIEIKPVTITHILKREEEEDE